MMKSLALALLSFLLLLSASPGSATDPPHDSSNSIECSSCHTLHNSPGGALTAVLGNANLCQSCHVSGGPAASLALVEADQALPGPVLPAGVSPSGTSHRWDSSPAGHIVPGAGNTSTGTITPGGVYTGSTPETFVLTITAAGDVGSAQFSWTQQLGSPAPSTSSTVRDEFTSISYGGNNGSDTWVGTWSETDDRGGGVTGGNIRVVSSTNCAAGNCLRVQARKSGDLVRRTADLTGASSATLRYDFNNLLDRNDTVVVQVFDGSSWSSALRTYDGNNRGSGSEAIDISFAIASTTQVRMRVTNNDRDQFIYFDNVEIEYIVGGGTNPPASGTGTAGAAVPLTDGVTATFANGGASPSFRAGDTWNLYVVPDLRPPTDPEMSVRLESGQIMCSTCHNQHSQEHLPFDITAPPYGGAGTGEGRKHHRSDNDQSQLCTDCHAARDVADAALGSHPVGMAIPGGDYQSPATLPLDGSNLVRCQTCHDVHFAPSTDGSLRRIANARALCTECHTLADTSTPSPHFDLANASTLWPGGEYGSNRPANTGVALQGSCSNCHAAHGWPDSAAPASDNPLLTVDFEEDLCFTCHDGAPVAPSVRADMLKSSAHPVAMAAGVHDPAEAAVVDSPNRHVECTDCHDSHQVKPSAGVPGPSTSPYAAGGPLAGVAGVDVAGNPVTPVTYEYELCFRCHGDSTGKPAAPTPRQFSSTNVRTEFDGTAASFHPVTTAGGDPSSEVPSLINGWQTSSILACTSCHNSDTSPLAGGAGANGPHGSTFSRLLAWRFESSPLQSYQAAKYDLCFQCHSESSILGDQSFKEHDKHIRGEGFSCNACHDPHASSGFDRLINFDTSIVSPRNGTMEWVDDNTQPGQFRGSCTLSCHGKDHNQENY